MRLGGLLELYLTCVSYLLKDRRLYNELVKKVELKSVLLFYFKSVLPWFFSYFRLENTGFEINFVVNSSVNW